MSQPAKHELRTQRDPPRSEGAPSKRHAAASRRSAQLVVHLDADARRPRPGREPRCAGPRARARAGRNADGGRGARGGGRRLFFLVVAPTIILLVSNPLGLLALFGLCLLFAYLIAFGGAL